MYFHLRDHTIKYTVKWQYSKVFSTSTGFVLSLNLHEGVRTSHAQTQKFLALAFKTHSLIFTSLHSIICLMSGETLHPLNRKRFLKLALGTAGGLILAQFAAAPQSVDSEPGQIYTTFLPQIKNDYPHPSDSLKKGAVTGSGDWNTFILTGAYRGYSHSRLLFPQPVEIKINMIPMIKSKLEIGLPISPSDWLMGFNEPDIDSPYSGLLDPAEAAMLWHDYFEPTGRKLVSPAPSHLHPEWLVQFRDAYLKTYHQAPRLDALAIHSYLTDLTNCKELMTRVINWSNEWNIPNGVRLTEFAIPDIDVMKKFINWLEDEPRVEEYDWFISSIDPNAPWAPNWPMPLAKWQTGELTQYGFAYAQSPQKFITR